MRTLYVSRQGCWVGVRQECLRVVWRGEVVEEVGLPTLEQVLVFGRSQVSVDAIRACLQRDVPVAFLSRQGYCYGRLIGIERGYRRLGMRQRGLDEGWRLGMARLLVWGKVMNGRVLLMRQLRGRPTESGEMTVGSLGYLGERALRAEGVEELRGIEGTAAQMYFQELGNCLVRSGFALVSRTRRPPTNPVNAMLSFGYMVLWNHLLTLVELQDLDPYEGCFHASGERHAALVSDLIEPFRAPVVDSLVLWLVNKGVMDAEADFDFVNGGCVLNEEGRRKYLRAFVQRMEGKIQTDAGEQPRWDLLTQEVRKYKQCVYEGVVDFQPYRIR